MTRRELENSYSSVIFIHASIRTSPLGTQNIIYLVSWAMRLAI
jgi:hypothetical protein